MYIVDSELSNEQHQKNTMIAITLALGLLLVGVVYVFLRWNKDYWRERGVPGPKPSLLTGNYPNMYTMKRHQIYDLKDIYK